MISFHTALKETKTEALLDSGATENFISPTLVKRLGLKTRKTTKGIRIRTVDGTGHKDGQLNEFLWLAVRLGGGKRTLMLFLVASLGEDHLILGYPFLYHFNPSIDWRKGKIGEGEIRITSTKQERGDPPARPSVAQQILQIQRAAIRQCGYPKEGEAIYIRRTNYAQQWAQKEATKQGPKNDTIPEEYHRHQIVFSEEASKRFPPKRSEDMTIKLKEDAPDSIDCKVYPLSPKDRVRMQTWIAGEEKLERIFLDKSNIVSPVYFTGKKDSDEKRIIMDYKKVNEHTIKDHNPLPNIQEALERLHGKRLFSKFDIRWGYNNIRIAEEDQHKAAFKTPFGTYVPRVMYFGLCNAPPFFQRTMNRDFRKLLQRYPDELGNYMDDWWVATTDDEEGRTRHKEIVHAFLDRMEECSYFLKPSKCQFERESLTILGWVVGGGHVRIDPAKANGLKEWPRKLKNVREVRQILGLLGYQRPFIRGFAHIAKPLHDLTKKDVPFLWTEECRKALDQLIDQVTSDPVLRHPNPNQQYELYVDASTYALGAVLAQRDEDDKQHAVAYLSRALRAPERNYTIADKEFLAIIEALKRVRHLVKDSPHKLIIYTDHDNLRYYRHPQKLNRRVARYLGFLEDFDYELRHIAGTKNWADPLSRRPDHDDGKGDNEDMVALPDKAFVRIIDLTILDQQIEKEQKEDLPKLNSWGERYIIRQGEDNVWRLKAAMVVTRPEAVRTHLLQQYHDSPTAGHPGIWKTLQVLLKDYWWPTIRDDVKAYVQGCLKCQATKTITKQNTPPIQPIPSTSTTPFASIAVDFITKLPKSGECDSILTITDHDCTKAVLLIPCKEEMTTEGFLELYRERAFPYIGIPRRLISDRDVRFTSGLFKELCAQLAIKHNMSTAYHPQTDGQSERTNQSVETILRIYCNQAQDNWREWLPVVQYIINSRPSATTKASPYELWMGYTPQTHQPTRPSQLPHFERRKLELYQARKAAQNAMTQAQSLWEKKTTYTEYQKGDKVWLEGKNLKTTHPTNKLRDKRFGPFLVSEVLGKVNYRLDLPPNWKIHNVFHASVLHPCKQTSINPNQHEEPTPELVEGQEEYEVEQILGTRRSGRNKALQYLVRWKGYSTAHDSWEPATGVHAPDLVKEYYAKYPRSLRRMIRDKKEERDMPTTHSHSILCRRILVDMSTPPRTMARDELENLLRQTIDGTSSDQRALMERVLAPPEFSFRQTAEDTSSSTSTGPELVPNIPEPTDTPSETPSSPSSLGISWLFAEAGDVMRATWADPLLQYPEDDTASLAQLRTESTRILRAINWDITKDWDDPEQIMTFAQDGRPGTPNCLKEKTPDLPTPPQYTTRGVSPIGDEENLSIKELWDKIRNYEKELQTLHIVQGRQDFQEFVREVLRENPGIFRDDPDFLAAAQVDLSKNPQQELLEGILSAAALHPTPIPTSSPAPLPVPPPRPRPRPRTSSSHMSQADESACESASYPSAPSSPVPSPRVSYAEKEPSLENKLEEEHLEAIGKAPRGQQPGPTLLEPGWHQATQGGRRLQIPSDSRAWGQVPARFLRYYVHPWSAEPTIEGAEGENTGVYGEKLQSEPQPDIPSSFGIEKLDDTFGPAHYFHGGVERALWQLGDYGLAADAWRLYSRPLRERKLHEQELAVGRLESLARQERTKYNQDKEELNWDMHNVRERLHEARALERLHPYLVRDAHRRETTIHPAKTRGARNTDIERRRAREADYTCPYCQEKGHYRHRCRHPHLHCTKINAKICEIPLTHHYFHDHCASDCPAGGAKSQEELDYEGPWRHREDTRP
jgi:hypothetical protein